MEKAQQWSIALKIGACSNKISALCLEQFNTNRSEEARAHLGGPAGEGKRRSDQQK